MATTAGISFQNPLKYTGPQTNIVPIKMFPREPLETDTKYPIGTLAIIGPDPQTGTKGDLWYLSEFNTAGEAIWLQLLTGTSAEGIDSITTDSGVPAIIPDGNGNVNIIAGSGGVSVTGNGPGDTVTISVSGGGIVWSVVSTPTKQIVVHEGYFSNGTSGIIFNLPVTAEVGDTFSICNMNTGIWTITQNASQYIRIGDKVTTTGVGGSLAATAIGDSVTIVCNVQNEGFFVVSSMGNITYV